MKKYLERLKEIGDYFPIISLIVLIAFKLFGKLEVSIFMILGACLLTTVLYAGLDYLWFLLTNDSEEEDVEEPEPGADFIDYHFEKMKVEILKKALEDRITKEEFSELMEELESLPTRKD